MTSRAKCHCGAIVLELPDVPDKAVECNCSICRRLGSLWVYRPLADVVVSHDEGATSTYVWGDKRIAFHTCRICGCTTHWLPLIDEYSVMGINARMIDGLSPSDVEIGHEDYGGNGCFWS